MSWAWTYSGLTLNDTNPDAKYLPLYRSPARQEILERAHWNWDVWGQPDERMVRPFWYFRINQRRRVRPQEKHFRDFYFRELYSRKTNDRWWKHFQGTEEFNEAIAKGERPNPIFRTPRTHGLISPRELMDANFRHKMNTWRHYNSSIYLMRQYYVDSFARPADPQVPFPVKGKWTRRYTKYIRPLLPGWWVPRLWLKLRYALVGGRMPWLLWADRYRYFYRRSERIEWRKSKRQYVRTTSTNPQHSIQARERYAYVPERLRPLAGVIVRFIDRNYLQPMIQPAYGRMLSATFIKIPLAGAAVYSVYKVIATGTSNVLADHPPDVFDRLEVEAAKVGDPYTPPSDELWKEHLEYKYPRKLQ